MAPKTKKIKTNHVQETTVTPVVTPVVEPAVVEEPVVVEEKEPEWYLLEDLEAEDIDDEYGDMVIQQRLLVNNVVCH
jgi:rRNA-processing protein EBP2